MEFSYTQEEGTQGVAIFFIFLKKWKALFPVNV